MKKIAAALLLLLTLTGSTGCKKFIENQKENALVNIMTDGKWIVTSYTLNTVDITSNFDGYAFKYYANRKVDAIKDGTFEKQGSWDGDIETMTTWAEFENAVEPLFRVNGYWHIDDSGLTYVIASQRDAMDTRIMRLDKIP